MILAMQVGLEVVMADSDLMPVASLLRFDSDLFRQNDFVYASSLVVLQCLRCGWHQSVTPPSRVASMAPCRTGHAARACRHTRSCLVQVLPSKLHVVVYEATAHYD